MENLLFRVKVENAKDADLIYPNKLESLFAGKIVKDKYMKELINKVKEKLSWFFQHYNAEMKLVVSNGYDVYSIGKKYNYQEKGNYTFTVVAPQKFVKELKEMLLNEFSQQIEAI